MEVYTQERTNERTKEISTELEVYTLDPLLFC